MIFEHLFYDNFFDNFLFHIHIIFHLSLYCFGFRPNTYFFFVKHGCHISCQTNGCLNNTSHLILTSRIPKQINNINKRYI